ncbi:hypothetical protein [Salinimonas lutimaris]|uniref:hypothetical protein n=1 Tax=Salinimonas lutimaris TaxID=914153 RepID=UPI0010C042F7|nr:hypothetical protein [Salinimonas lutimaris]
MNVTAVVIVAIVGVTIIKLAKLMDKARQNKSGSSQQARQYDTQIAALRERIEVLERIVTDEGYDLKKQFNNLNKDDDHVA